VLLALGVLVLGILLGSGPAALTPIVGPVLRFVIPRNLSDLFIETEGFLFIPLLAYGYWRGWWPRLPYYMNHFLGLDHKVKVDCPRCALKFEAEV
jgi:hypothetical protein